MSERLACELCQEGSDLLGRAHVIHSNVSETTGRHAGERGVLRVLDDGDPPVALDLDEAQRSIIEVAGEDDADDGGTEFLSGGAEEGIDRRARVILARPACQEDAAVLDEQMLIGRSDVDSSRLDELAICCRAGGQVSLPAEDFGQVSRGCGGHVHDNEYSGLKRIGQTFDHLSQGAYAAGGSAHHDDRESVG